MQYYLSDTTIALARWESVLRAAAARKEHPEIPTAVKLAIQLAAKDVSNVFPRTHDPLGGPTDLTPQDLLTICEANQRRTLRSTKAILEDIFLEFAAKSLPHKAAALNADALARLEFLQQRFEAGGVLCEAYEGVPLAERKVSDSLSLYALLGWSTLLASMHHPDDTLYFLNTALKVSDLLVALHQQPIQLEETLLSYSFVLTCNHALNELYDSRGFRLPIA